MPQRRRFRLHDHLDDDVALWCHSCGDSFRTGTTWCPTCDAPLESDPPADAGGHLDPDGRALLFALVAFFYWIPPGVFGFAHGIAWFFLPALLIAAGIFALALHRGALLLRVATVVQLCIVAALTPMYGAGLIFLPAVAMTVAAARRATRSHAYAIPDLILGCGLVVAGVLGVLLGGGAIWWGVEEDAAAITLLGIAAVVAAVFCVAQALPMLQLPPRQSVEPTRGEALALVLVGAAVLTAALVWAYA
jgi:hypothetical protein